MPKTVLIVDDGAFMRVLIKGMLEKNDYVVVGEAEDGEKGVRLYKTLRPDVVTMDITMPNKDGISALREIVAFDSEAKIIMVSAMGQESLVKESILAGAKSFVLKPFDESGLLSVLEAI